MQTTFQKYLHRRFMSLKNIYILESLSVGTYRNSRTRLYMYLDKNGFISLQHSVLS
jgi:hypothetical protein